MMTNRIKFGVIGVGLMGSLFAEIVNDLPECELIAVADLDEAKVDSIMKRHKVVGYTDYQELLARNDINSVIIAVPRNTI